MSGGYLIKLGTSTIGKKIIATFCLLFGVSVLKDIKKLTLKQFNSYFAFDFIP